MISTGLFSVKPMPAAAQPEYELSIDTTTGMSAPPIGMISVTPSTRAMATMARKAACASVTKYTTPKPTIAMASTRFSRCWPAKVTAFEPKRPESLP